MITLFEILLDVKTFYKITLRKLFNSLYEIALSISSSDSVFTMLIAVLFGLVNVYVLKIYLVTVKAVRSLIFILGDCGKEKLIPLIQGPSDTRDLHSSKWLNESRKPESLLAPDLVAFTIQIPQYMDYCHNSGKYKTLAKLVSHYIFPIQCNFQKRGLI